jgi:predicted dehydrogenase|tara:strand:- start:7 stop:525 length:519 start_codon:yes stop_codon:yes gene_type:complete
MRQSSLAYKQEEEFSIEAKFKTGIGVIGAGYWAPKLAKTFNGMDDTKVIAICDINPDKMRLFRAQDPSISCYGDYRDLISNGKISAVAISITDSARYEVAQAALNNGIHVMVESFDGASNAEIESLEMTAIANGRQLSIISLPNGGMLAPNNALPTQVQARIDAFMGAIEQE